VFVVSERVPIEALRPSQLYLHAGKLAAVLERVEGETLEYDPLPVFAFDGERSLTDGHTRAFVAHLTGADELRVVPDPDLPENHDVALYRECIAWCEAAGVESVADLSGRVLGPDEYERRWIERCHRAAERLDGA